MFKVAKHWNLSYMSTKRIFVAENAMYFKFHIPCGKKTVMNRALRKSLKIKESR